MLTLIILSFVWCDQLDNKRQTDTDIQRKRARERGIEGSVKSKRDKDIEKQ